MKIEVVGRTNTDIDAITAHMSVDARSTDMEDLIEFAGRACYQSFNKPNSSTRLNADYIANIIAQKHESVLEHSSVSFYVQGVSRNMLLELERHRHLSFSVISTRFVSMEDAMVVVPVPMRVDEDEVMETLDPEVAKNYRSMVEGLQGEGYSRKQAREAARYLLPGNLETKFVVTGNLRAWRDVLKKRYSVHADAEIRLFASAVLELLRKEAPSVFADITLEE